MNAEVLTAKFALGQIVKHRRFSFRGVIHNIDPKFANTEEWYQAIPAEVRPSKNQPFYHLFAVGESGPYEAYVSEQNLLPDADGGPVGHPMIEQMFDRLAGDRYVLKRTLTN